MAPRDNWLPLDADGDEISFEQALQYARNIAHAESPWDRTHVTLTSPSGRLLIECTGRLHDQGVRQDQAESDPPHVFRVTAGNPWKGVYEQAGAAMYVLLRASETTRCTVGTLEYGDLYSLEFEGPGSGAELQRPLTPNYALPMQRTRSRPAGPGGTTSGPLLLTHEPGHRAGQPLSPSVHTALPVALERAAGVVLDEAGVRHVAHGERDHVAAATAAAGDADAVALIGPFRSRAVAEAIEVTAPAGLALLAPVATWAGVTRDDEPGCDDPADHRGTVLRMVARDTEVAFRLAAHLRRTQKRALVVSGGGEYGTQLEAQLRLAELPRAGDDADLVVVAGVPSEPGMERAAATAPLPIIAFDGVQGLDIGFERDVWVVLPFAEDPAEGAEAARAARLVVGALAGGARTRVEVLAACRAAGPFDEHGDPLNPPVWLWRAATDWTLRPERPLAV